MGFFCKKHVVIAVLMTVLWGFRVNAQKYEVMVITGQNNHHWPVSSEIIKEIFDNSGMFNATIVITPAKGEDMSVFKPEFGGYDLICMDYNGDPWPEETKKRFVDFVKKGGGLVVFHASDNSFPEWKEYNRMIGLGGWGGRTEKDGPYVYWEDGKVIKDKSPGKGGHHGKQGEYVVETRNADHPIMKGLPLRWMHVKDELYNRLRGPAKQMEILATAAQDTSVGGPAARNRCFLPLNMGRDVYSIRLWGM